MTSNSFDLVGPYDNDPDLQGDTGWTKENDEALLASL